MIPLLRTEQILVQEVGDELIIYDRKSCTSHCLNQIAARVWHYCNGHNTVEDIAKLLEKELELSPNQTSELGVAKENVNSEVLVWQALEEFERYQLLQEYIQPGAASLSRRKAIKKAAIGGGVVLGALLPMIRSIVVPTPVMAKSPASPHPHKHNHKHKWWRWRWWS